MISNRSTRALALLSIFLLLGHVTRGQPAKNAAQYADVPLTWSSKNCATCESSILNPGWYSDGSGLFTEAMQGKASAALVGVSLTEGNLVVAVGFGIVGDGSLTISPKEAVRLETDSGSRMVLYALDQPDPRIPKGNVSVKKQFKAKSVSLKTGTWAAGYLFFPNDADASHVTVVVALGEETFRFPFARKPEFRAKFIDPDAGSVPVPVEPATKASRLLPQSHSEHTSGVQPQCTKNISFAVAENGGITTLVPGFAEKWIKKNRKKYPGACFSQTPIDQVDNYLLVFAYATSAYDGLYPTVRTSTNTSTSPVSGSGTVTDNYGGMWNYTYSGTTTTTTTTNEHLNLPYTDESNTLYMYTYDQRGTLRSRHWRTVTTRSGGDTYNTLGYNLGALLGAIHMKDRLLNDAVNDVAGVH